MSIFTPVFQSLKGAAIDSGLFEAISPLLYNFSDETAFKTAFHKLMREFTMKLKSDSATPEFCARFVDFSVKAIDALNDIVSKTDNKALAQALEKLRSEFSHAADKRQAVLKFLSEEIVQNALMENLRKSLLPAYLTPEERVKSIIDEANAEAYQDWGTTAQQGAYDPERRIFRELIRTLLVLIEICCASPKLRDESHKPDHKRTDPKFIPLRMG